MSEIKWNITREDAELIRDIAARARKINSDLGFMTTNMDITATHLNGCKLDLQKLHDFDDFNLMHDVIGIHNCIDRHTGKINEKFLPRCATKVETPKFVVIENTEDIHVLLLEQLLTDTSAEYQVRLWVEYDSDYLHINCSNQKAAIDLYEMLADQDSYNF